MLYDDPLNLTAFNEVDPSGFLTVTPSRVTATNMNRIAYTQLTYDFGKGEWHREIKWSFMSTAGNGGYDVLCAFANSDDNWYRNVTRGIGVMLYTSGSTVLMVLQEKKGTSNDFNQAVPNIALALNTQYWAKLIITESRADAYYYSDAAMQNLAGTHGLNLSFTPDDTWKYLHTAGSLRSGTGDVISCWSEDYQLLNDSPNTYMGGGLAGASHYMGGGFGG
jgi:hypothetical protein